jgi:hypothetical protein
MRYCFPFLATGRRRARLIHPPVQKFSMAKQRRGITLTQWNFIGMAAGLALGWIFPDSKTAQSR